MTDVMAGRKLNRDRRIELKVKVKSLAEEARVIRREEGKAKGLAQRIERKVKASGVEMPPADPAAVAAWETAWETRCHHRQAFHRLQEHRRGKLRVEARCAQLAYGYIRGRKYSQLEGTRRANNPPDGKRVVEIVWSFGNPPYLVAELDGMVRAWLGLPRGLA